jgi:GAF domain-containing protein
MLPRERGAGASERLATLAEISRLVTSSLEPQAVLGATVEATARLLGVEDVRLLLLDDSAGLLHLSAKVPAAGVAAETALPVEGSLSGWVLRSGRPFVTHQVSQHPLWRDLVPGPDSPRSGIFVPFFHQERSLGVLVALSALGRSFSDEDVELVQALAAQVAVAIQNARTYGEARDQARQLAAILDVNKRLARGLQLERILPRITEEAARLLNVDGARLRLLEGEELVRVAAFGPAEVLMAPERLKIGESLNGRVVAAGQPIIGTDLATDPRFDPAYQAKARGHGVRSWLGVPLRGRTQIVGTLSAVAKGTGRFTQADVQLLEAFADQAAIAIENAGLLTTAERRAAEALAVAEVGRAMTRSLDLQAVLELIVDQACRLLGTERSGLALVEPEGSESVYRFVARRGLSDHFPERMRPRSWRDGTTAAAIAERRPIWSSDILHDPAFDLTPPIRAAVEAEGYHAVLSAPLLTGDRALGALVVYRDAVGPFSSDEIDLLRILADQAAIAIENARAFQRERQRRRQLEVVREVTGEITRELDLTKLLELITRRAVELVDSVAGTVFLWDEASQALILRASHGFEAWPGEARVPLGAGLVGSVAEGRQGMIVNDYGNSPFAYPPLLERMNITACLSQPILYRDQLVGVLTVGHGAADRPFAEQDQELLSIFADEAAIAIENARLYRELGEREARLHDLVGRLLLAQEEERRRVAYDIHDGLAQVAAAAQQHLEAFASNHRPRSPQGRQELDRVRELAQGAVREARRIIAGLRPTALDDFGLATALRLEVEALGVDGWHVTYQEQLGSERLPSRVETALLRVAQEALENVRKHARTTRVHLALERRGRSVRLEVRDWGRGFRPSAVLANSGPSERVGLPGMQERIGWLGGRCTVRSRPGAGTRIEVEVPLPAAAVGAAGNGR